MNHTTQSLAQEASPKRTLRLVNRHAHDVRNQLNCLELELMLLGELTNDAPTLDCVERLRAHVATLEMNVKSLVVKFAEPNPILVAAEDLLRLWQGQTAPLLGPGRDLEWVMASLPADLRLDARAVVAGLTELTLAAWSRARGRRLTAVLAVTETEARVSLREPGQSVALAPELVWELARLVTANHGRLEHAPAENAQDWVTTLTFPVLPRLESNEEDGGPSTVQEAIVGAIVGESLALRRVWTASGPPASPFSHHPSAVTDDLQVLPSAGR
jgi:hypothetical protein